MKNRKIKTLKELEEDEKKDWNRLKIYGAVIVFFIVVLLLFLLQATMSSCSSRPVHAQAHYEFRQDTTELRAIIRAYNHLLHRVWIDKPNYCEDALCETPEFIELNDLLYSQWEDTFTFYNEQDSIDYHYNWRTGDGRFSDYE